MRCYDHIDNEPPLDPSLAIHSAAINEEQHEATPLLFEGTPIDVIAHQNALPADRDLASRNIGSILFRPLISLGTAARQVALRGFRVVASSFNSNRANRARITNENEGGNELIAHEVTPDNPVTVVGRAFSNPVIDIDANRERNRSDPRNSTIIDAATRGHDCCNRLSEAIQRFERISGPDDSNTAVAEAKAQLQRLNEALHNTATHYEAAQASDPNVREISFNHALTSMSNLNSVNVSSRRATANLLSASLEKRAALQGIDIRRR